MGQSTKLGRQLPPGPPWLRLCSLMVIKRVNLCLYVDTEFAFAAVIFIALVIAAGILCIGIVFIRRLVLYRPSRW